MSTRESEPGPSPGESAIPLLIVVIALAAIIGGALLIVPLIVEDLAGRNWQASIPVLFGRSVFWVVLAVIVILPALLAAHYRIVGPKLFDHTGKRFLVFTLVTRINHWIAAITCTVLVLTGLAMMYAAAPGAKETVEGTNIARLAWRVHGIIAIAFTITAGIMMARWAGKMLPRRHDIGWLKIAGGYLSRKKRPVPAHMFNLGQKLWFWLSTLGGLVMTATGGMIFMFWGGNDLLNVMALVHHAVAALIVTMFIVHVYMSVFAIKGSLMSMIDGKKYEDELVIMHGMYYDELREGPAEPPPAPTSDE